MREPAPLAVLDDVTGRYGIVAVRVNESGRYRATSEIDAPCFGPGHLQHTLAAADRDDPLVSHGDGLCDREVPIRIGGQHFAVIKNEVCISDQFLGQILGSDGYRAQQQHPELLEIHQRFLLRAVRHRGLSNNTRLLPRVRTQ